MKNLDLLFVRLTLSGVAVWGFDDNGSSASKVTSNANAGTIINNMKSGTWKVTSFVENGNDETNYFTDYNFTFKESGVLTATDGIHTHTGSWSIIDGYRKKDCNNNGNNDNVDFSVGFTGPDKLTELANNRDVMERTRERIMLEDINAGNKGTGCLIFEKN